MKAPPRKKVMHRIFPRMHAVNYRNAVKSIRLVRLLKVFPEETLTCEGQEILEDLITMKM